MKVMVVGEAATSTPHGALWRRIEGWTRAGPPGGAARPEAAK